MSVLLQGFQTHTPADGTLWRALAAAAPGLAAAGFSGVWLPPAGKGSGGATDLGYGVYDLYDLGEFDQKGTVPTRYGTRAELEHAVHTLRAHGLEVLADMVFNQRNGGDGVEVLAARRVDPDDRTRMEDAPRTIRAWTQFDFPGRDGAYSPLRLRAEHFTAVDTDGDDPTDPYLYLLDGKRFSEDVSHEHGNFDFLLGCDVDLAHPEVRADLFRYGDWFFDTVGATGVRLDALKHVDAGFVRDWLAHVRERRPGLPAVGEYWTHDPAELVAYRERVGALLLFDVPLHHRFCEAGRAGAAFDLRTLFDGTLVRERPDLAVPFVDNHDTEPGQSLESWVEPWFKPLAYAAILLRRDGVPCVYDRDYYGLPGGDEPGHRALLDVMLAARASHGHGDQHDLFDDPHRIAWVRTGDEGHPGVMVVIIGNGDAGTLRVGTGRAHHHFVDATGHVDGAVETDGEGFADLPCPAGSLAIWLG